MSMLAQMRFHKWLEIFLPVCERRETFPHTLVGLKEDKAVMAWEALRHQSDKYQKKWPQKMTHPASGAGLQQHARNQAWGHPLNHWDKCLESSVSPCTHLWHGRAHPLGCWGAVTPMLQMKCGWAAGTGASLLLLSVEWGSRSWVMNPPLKNRDGSLILCRNLEDSLLE